MQIFGKSAQELNPLNAQGSAGIAELTEEAKRMGAVMSGDSLNALGAFDDSIQRLKAGGEAAKNMLGTVLLPQIQQLADGVVPVLGVFYTGYLRQNGNGQKSEVLEIRRRPCRYADELPSQTLSGRAGLCHLHWRAIVEHLAVIIDAARISS
jgi:hypothetical protein